MVSSMAYNSMARVWTVLVVMLIFFVASAKVAMVEGVTVTVENESVTVGQKLALHCRNNAGKDFGPMTLDPFTHFSWSFTTSFLGTDVMTCTFATPGKPTTTIDVFKGYSFKRPPCNCNGVNNCFWQALNDGFWCNSNFVQGWG